MEFVKIDKVSEGEFINRFDITYKTVSGYPKVYEMISRDKEIHTLEELNNHSVDAVVMIMFKDSDREKILLSKEFRMAPGEWVYNFPAGIIEDGESFSEAAKRELREETGLEIKEIVDTSFESYSAVGYSNEKNVCVVGVCDGEIRCSDSEFEEIEAGFYTKEEVRELLKNNKFSSRAQGFCYAWAVLETLGLSC
ncbi:ADP-ribose pyrophosphatase [Lachnospiraceae bacterium RM5]|nr:ADP-ribose pyrophosphatase [Lachnospiraceae bacterium RM5]